MRHVDHSLCGAGSSEGQPRFALPIVQPRACGSACGGSGCPGTSVSKSGSPDRQRRTLSPKSCHKRDAKCGLFDDPATCGVMITLGNCQSG